VNVHVQALLDLVHQDLKAAHLMLEQELVRAAINRAYYAAFHVAQAALLTVEETPRTHAGVSNRFYVRFVQTNLIGEDLGSVLPYAFRQRQGADYDALTVFEARAAADMIAEVESFVRAVEAIIGAFR
jgi:hypothetical protein